MKESVLKQFILIYQVVLVEQNTKQTNKRIPHTHKKNKQNKTTTSSFSVLKLFVHGLWNFLFGKGLNMCISRFWSNRGSVMQRQEESENGASVTDLK